MFANSFKNSVTEKITMGKRVLKMTVGANNSTLNNLNSNK